MIDIDDEEGRVVFGTGIQASEIGLEGRREGEALFLLLICGLPPRVVGNVGFKSAGALELVLDEEGGKGAEGGGG